MNACSLHLLLLLLALLAVAPPASADEDCSKCMPKKSEALLMAKKNAAGAYGKGASAGEAVPISRILDDPNAFVDKEITVEGLVVDVCSTRGCWMQLAGDRPYTTLKAKVCDGEIVFPLSARGRSARVTGILQGIALDREATLNHFEALAKAKGEPFDPNKIEGTATIYQIRATGVTIK